ncbi:MAG TPA: DUF1501 domain-containing protein [Pirellulales bacterium]|nr:DUF1501 domain-containing protein [Pirellulales bacterium]
MHGNDQITLHSPAVSRRQWLHVGGSGLLGLTLPDLLRRQAQASESGGVPRAKSVVLVFLTGAASHHDTFDMKPDAPDGIRGEFQPIATSVPGIQICEHLPRLAERAHQYALVRSLSHRDNNHLMSTHHVLTGHIQPGAFFDKVASRDDWPCYSSACDHFRPRHDGIPTGVNLPTFLLEGPLTWPGQHAGFLGAKHDPWQITGDPNKPDFRVDSLTLATGVEMGRLENRQSLLDQLNRQQRQLTEAAECRRLSDEQRLAFSVLTSSRLAQAFDLTHEPDAVRDRYGRHLFGQSLLLARRLVQVGVPLVQANMGRVQNWDHHSNIFPTLKNRMLPPLDQAVSALLDDLSDLGLLDDTFVFMLGEFGRTPKISRQRPDAPPGRDHWGPCFTGLFAGAGVRGGQVIGKSDKIGAYPLTPPFSPDDVGATVLSLLGVDPAAQIHDRQGRPMQLNQGAVMEALFTGRVS